MKASVLFWFVMVCYTVGTAQIRYEEGYYIDNAGKRHAVFIKNVDWKNNPKKFSYKEKMEDKHLVKKIEEVMEFGIDDFSKYKRFYVKIDRSSNYLNRLSKHKEMDWDMDTLFLKTLVEGKAELYIYEHKDYVRFYYSKDGGDIQALVYKKYRASGQHLGEVNRFRLQLWNNVKCEGMYPRDVEKLRYTQKDLIAYFTKYNACFKIIEDPVNFEQLEKRDALNIYLRPGINFGSIQINTNLASSRMGKIRRSPATRFGIEFEYILPFNKGKWALLVEPTFQSYKTDQMLSGKETVVDYKSIQLPLGIRHYFFLSKKSRIFLNAHFLLDIDLDNSLISFEQDPDLIISSTGNLAAGLGFNYNNRVSLEFRYGARREILKTSVEFTSKYTSYGIVLGLNIL